MEIFWTGDIDRPDEAVEYTNEGLRKKHISAKWAAKVVGNPAVEFDGQKIDSRNCLYEIYSEHDRSTIDKKLWSNNLIVGNVGVLSGFGTDVSLQIVAAARPKTLPGGAKGFSVLFINGPNLNLLGTRQPEIYGKQTLTAIFGGMRKRHPELEVEVMQSNSEGAIVDIIHSAQDRYDAIVINAGAYTHTSIAIHDALKNFDDIIIEVHISNPHQR